jgi:hypothetical protein
VWFINPRPDLRTRYIDFRTRGSTLRFSERDKSEDLDAQHELEAEDDLHDGAEQANEQADDDREDATDEPEHDRDKSREADAVFASDTIGAINSNNWTYSR